MNQEVNMSDKNTMIIAEIKDRVLYDFSWLDDTHLNTATDPFDFDEFDAEKIHYAMSNLLTERNALGCSANQVGWTSSFFCFGDPKDPSTHVTVFNPNIVDYFGEEVYYEEGCLSFPGLLVKIKRPENIRARFTSWDGNTDTLQFKGMSSRVFQHEYDHLSGVSMHRRANSFHLDSARRKQKKWSRLNKKRSKDSSLLKHSASLTEGGTNG
jgi:peptide deformylase